MSIMNMTNRTYSELINIPTFEGRYEYLRLSGQVGKDTFGYDRYLNQAFYRSKEWKEFRRYIIVRDDGCDLGIEDHIITGRIIIHHINPITPDDLINGNIESILCPENAICVSASTHNAIHYGDASLLITEPIERSKNDTCPWRQCE